MPTTIADPDLDYGKSAIHEIDRFALVQWGAATVFWLEYVYKVQVVCKLNFFAISEIVRDSVK
jgi:hypothetical protein